MTERGKVVALLRSHGFRCDIFESDTDRIEILIEPASHIVGEGTRLMQVLEKKGVKIGQSGNEDGLPFILGTYDPAQHDAFLSLWGVEDKDIGES